MDKLIMGNRETQATEGTGHKIKPITTTKINKQTNKEKKKKKKKMGIHLIIREW